MRQSNSIPLLYTSILYCCGFFLFLEWLYPLNEFTDIHNLAIFIIYAVFCFLISLFNFRWWISLVIKGVGLLFITDYLFTNDPLWGDFSFSALYLELSTNINMLFAGNWYQITDIFRSILFLILIWMISYLIYYWFIVMKRILLFIILTFIYITVLDTFTFYDASFAIIRIFILSFLALGMANIFKEIHHQNIPFSWMKNKGRWIIPIVGGVLFTALLGYSAPKYDPQWPDPVPFLQGVADYSNNSGINSRVNRSGYSVDDSRLGGSFIQDDTIAFHATAEHREYWRVETRDVYTGKGWESSTPDQYIDLAYDDYSLITYSENIVTEEKEAWIEFNGNQTIDKLVYPYGLDHVEVLAGPGLIVDLVTGAIQKQENNNRSDKEQYKTIYQKPKFDVEILRSVDDNDPEAILEHFTHIPEDLPSRIDELAAEITASETNRYDKAKAIEQYFGRSGFVYETDDVPYPAEDQDYVDQFLFETQAGYCDNYSTAMVVMLRTLDIPARWVKGFTGGEVVDSMIDSEDYDIYEVTNANAHSWVEVYFPDVGWVPFEPTQGFSNATEFVDSSIDIDEQMDEELIEDDEIEVPEQEDPETDEQNAVQEDEVEEIEEKSETHPLYYVIPIVLLIIIGVILFITRHRWRARLLFNTVKNRQDVDSYEKAYHYLLAQLRHKGLKRDPSQSLREYAVYVDQTFETNEMGILTNQYEHLLYNKQNKTIKDNEWIELWKNLIEHIQKSPRQKG